MTLGEYKKAGRKTLPKLAKQKNRMIAFDDLTYETAKALAHPDTVSKYLRGLIWADAEGRKIWPME